MDIPITCVLTPFSMSVQTDRHGKGAKMEKASFAEIYPKTDSEIFIRRRKEAEFIQKSFCASCESGGGFRPCFKTLLVEIRLGWRYNRNKSLQLPRLVRVRGLEPKCWNTAARKLWYASPVPETAFSISRWWKALPKR